MWKACISLPDEMRHFIKKRFLNLSRFVQEKLKEEMEKEKQFIRK